MVVRTGYLVFCHLDLGGGTGLGNQQVHKELYDFLPLGILQRSGRHHVDLRDGHFNSTGTWCVSPVFHSSYHTLIQLM